MFAGPRRRQGDRAPVPRGHPRSHLPGEPPAPCAEVGRFLQRDVGRFLLRCRAIPTTALEVVSLAGAAPLPGHGRAVRCWYATATRSGAGRRCGRQATAARRAPMGRGRYRPRAPCRPAPRCNGPGGRPRSCTLPIKSRVLCPLELRRGGWAATDVRRPLRPHGLSFAPGRRQRRSCAALARHRQVPENRRAVMLLLHQQPTIRTWCRQEDLHPHLHA